MSTAWPGPAHYRPLVPVPPVAERRAHVHRQHDVERPDPYAWMAELDEPALLAYLEQERAFYDAATEHLTDLRATLEAEMRARVPAHETGAPWQADGWEYRWERGHGAEHGRLVRRPTPTQLREQGQDPVADSEGWRELLDLDTLVGPDGHVELGVCAVSPDATLLAYSVDTSGDERFELRFADLSDGADGGPHPLPDRVVGVHAGGAWTAGSDAFCFVVPDEAWRAHEVRLHRLGGPPGQAEQTAELLLREPDPAFSVSVRLSRSRQLLLLSAFASDCSQEWVLPAQEPTGLAHSPGGRRAGIEYWLEHVRGPGGGFLLVVTNDGAPEFRLMRCAPDAPGPHAWTPLVDARPGERLLDVDAFAKHVVLSLRRDAAACLRVVPLDALAESGSARAWDLPAREAATISLSRTPDYATSDALVRTESAVEPRTTLRVNLEAETWPEEAAVVHRAEVPTFDASLYRRIRRWLPARDGTAIPVLLVHRADAALDGTAPCLLYGYGAYEAIEDPVFDPSLISLLDRGVVHGHVLVRGGGEAGRTWWEQGRLRRKPTSWHDLVDVADGLTGQAPNRKTPPLVDGRRMALRGISAGGLLVAGAMQDRPERFAAVIAEVPFVDVLTTMLDESIPLTTLEWTEWGDPRTPDGFQDLQSWSPYERTLAGRVGPGRRPRLLVTGALHDTRVRVTEPAKWVAAMRATEASQAIGDGDGSDATRLLLRAETGEGAHAGPSGRFARLAYEAELAAWLLDALAVAG